MDQLTLRRPQASKPGGLGSMRRQFTKKTLRTKRRLIAAIRRQYLLTHALSDVKAAALGSEDITFGALMMAAVVSYALLTTLANLLFIFMQTTAAFSTWSGISLGLLVMITLGIFISLSVWILAWGQNMLSISILESANRKQNRSIRTTIRHGLRSATRVTLAWLLVNVLTFAPAAVLGLILLGVLYASHVALSAALPYLFGVGALGIIWIGYAVANFALTPKVALFEPKLSLAESLGRSRQLLKSKGRVFLIGNYVALLATLALAYGLSNVLQWFTGVSNVLSFIIFAWVLFSLNNLIMSAFYRKRKLARK
ncbi:MAG TPA: hypothetical protein VN778_01545 [Verrucomicrobiae bacterium]|nr:hypothetical protein [Verrucomicrobiae bacterium]